MRSILVTGGAGYIGYEVISELIKKYPESKIIIYDNLSKGKIESMQKLKKRSKNIELIPWEKADIRDTKSVEEVLEKFKPEIVIHLAAIVDAFTTNREGKDRECELINHVATVNVAKLAKKHNVKIFIYQSSVSIYGKGENINEESFKNPLSTYGKTKIMAEKEILPLSDENFKVVILRPATIIGYNPSFRFETIINLSCIRSIYKIPINIFESALHGDKTYLDVRDNARAIIFSIENIDKMKKDYFNVTSFNTNLFDVLEILKNVLKEDFPYNIIKQKKINQQVYTINSDKIKRLGFIPIGKLDEILKDCIKGLKRVQYFFDNF